MTLVKVCGLTREHDVRRALELGAAVCGFILSASPRQVTPERAGELAAVATDGCLCAGVVTTEPAEWIAEAIDRAGLGVVQLSAGADGPTVTAVRDATARRGLRTRVIAAADTPDAATADFLLFDTRDGDVYGGTGVTLDWAALALAMPTKIPLILAGGLAPDNVGEAIATLWPSMVDVCSGTESVPGVKDEALLSAFFAAVAHADLSRGAAV